MQGSTYAPFAHARLAAIARYEGRPWEGLRHARLAIEGSAPKDRLARPAARAEFVRCNLELGLADCAVSESRAILAEHPLGSSMHAPALLLELDTCLALGDLRRVQKLTQKALAHPSIENVAPDLIAKIRLRLLLAERELASTRSELVQAARDIEAAATSIDEQDQSFVTAKLIAADAWLEAGEHDQVERIVESVEKGEADDVREDGRSLILRSRLAHARGAQKGQLADLRRRLEEVHDRWLTGLTSLPLRGSGYGLLNDRAISETLATLTWLDALALEPTEASAHIVRRTERLASMGTLSRRLGCTVGTPADLVALRNERGGVLLITAGPRAASIVAVDKETTVHALDLNADFWRDAARLSRAVAEGPQAGEGAGNVRMLAERLAQQFFPEAVRARITGWDHLLLIGSERATELLQLMPCQDTWLCLEKAITHAPSVAVAKALRERAGRHASRDRRNDLAVFANPSLAAATRTKWGVADLVIDPSRITDMAGAFTPERVIVRIGVEATAAALHDKLMQDTYALCILGHGIQDYERERSACLLVHGEDPASSAVGSDTIESTSMPPLVLLGVCEAASGPMRQGDEGAQHLGSAFLYAGADCVVLAPGRLALGATCDLLTVCLREWRMGTSVAEALRRARKHVASDENRAHPYFFAGLRTFGCDAPGLARR